MKKLIVLVLVVGLAFPVAAWAQAQPAATAAPAQEVQGNFSDEMKIPHATDLSAPDGADSVERQGDHPDSPYFRHPDFYNLEDTDSLTILTHFKTQQQSSEWNCGVSAVEMVLNWYGKLGNYNEQTLAQCRDNGLKAEATSLKQAIQVFEGVGGFDVYSTYDVKDKVDEVFTLDFIQKSLKEGKPIIIGWNDWGGHWQVIIGYDTMGTETQQDDVIIVADSYDTTDHNQDGYGIYPAERFIYNFSFYDVFPDMEIRDKAFLVATPK